MEGRADSFYTTYFSTIQIQWRNHSLTNATIRLISKHTATEKNYKM